MNASDSSETLTALVKVGGAALDQLELLNELARDITRIEDRSLVLVHGGSLDIKSELDLMNKPFEFVDGLRVTDAETLRVVEMVLSGTVNGRIVRALTNNGVKAIGLTGGDTGLIRAEPMTVDGKSLGFVGRVTDINPAILKMLFENEITPVVSPVSIGSDGRAYNVNADQVAAALASELKSGDLIFYSDVAGVNIDGRRAQILSPAEVEKHIADGQISGGMIPKVRSAVEALRQGVGRVHLTMWDGPGSLIAEIQGQSAGTVISL
ncbi:acetylglutamate kinase [candidate division KSB1 bacterium]